MEVIVKTPTTVDVTTITIMAKVRDSGSYQLVSKEGNVVHDRDDGYVPSFFPGDHHGDYLQLEVDIESGVIKNWVKPTQSDLQEFMESE